MTLPSGIRPKSSLRMRGIACGVSEPATRLFCLALGWSGGRISEVVFVVGLLVGAGIAPWLGG